MKKKNKKLKILIHSNYSRAKTGFGKHMKHLLTYLYKTGKYELIELSNAKRKNDPILKTLPWKAIGGLPEDAQRISEVNSSPQNQRNASYGHFLIDEIIQEEKPDIYLGIEDIWGLENFLNKVWWNKINSLIWTPVDSVPLLDKHINAVKKSKNLIVQASFAQKAFKEKGHENVHLLPVPLDPSNFYKLDEENRLNLRKENGIDPKSFIIGFVFRNQLRKSVPNLLEGFKKFQDMHPDSNAKLLLHTHWSEGWDIPKLIQEKQIKPEDVLTTYYCAECKQYQIKSFVGQKLDCPKCNSPKSQETAQTQRGPSEKQLNQIYNLMDVYCHPFTSGGQEIPIQEAKLTELITVTTNYSCGEDYCSEESGGMPLNWNEYREPGTQFIKASTCPIHISEQLSNVYNMPPKEKAKMGKKARDFTINFCSIDSVCARFDSLISKMSPTTWDFDFSYKIKNTNYVPPEIENHKDWLIDLYKNILNVEDPNFSHSQEINHWTTELLSEKVTRQVVYDNVIKAALKENKNNQKTKFQELLSKDDDGRRILFVMPENDIDVFNSTSLLKYFKDKYPDHNIYYATKTQYFPILNGNPYIHKVLPYDPIMENFTWSEGFLDHEKMFEFCLMPHTNTHKVVNYIHGGKHLIEYDLNYA